MTHVISVAPIRLIVFITEGGGGSIHFPKALFTTYSNNSVLWLLLKFFSFSSFREFNTHRKEYLLELANKTNG